VAQETTGTIQGVVKDPQGAVIKGASVEISGPALIGKQTATTDDAGNYRFTSLPPGLYEITVNAKGFGSVKQSNVSITAGSLPILNIGMKVGAESQVMEVSAEAVAVDTTSSKVQNTVTNDILTGMPKGRSFQSVIPFAPGARQEPLQGGTSSRTNGFQIDGATDSENVYMIDGINTTNIQNGGVGKNFQSDFIQEVQIKSSSFEAEFGGALGGVINAIPKKGSNQWHGEVKAYWQSSAFNANDPCASGFTSGGLPAGFSTTCGLQLDPTKAGTNTTTRLDGTPQYFVPEKDNHRILEPGFDLGGPLAKDRLWLFTSYIPTLDTTNRTTNFQGNFNNSISDPRTLTQTFYQHNWYTRLDYRVANSLRLYGSWNYAYSRTKGTLGKPLSAYGQLAPCGSTAAGVAQNCNGSSTDPASLRPDNGSVNPLSVYSFGGDWTPTSKLLASVRYGYFFYNNETRGTPTGGRYVYDNSVVGGASCTKDVTGACIPAAAINSAGFSNIPSTYATFFDAFKRKSWNADVSYFVGNFLGSHTFKGGYFWASQANQVFRTTNGPWVNLDWGIDYTPVTSTTACAAIQASNANGKCQGQFGYFYTGTTTTSNDGHVNATDQALYFQDSWTVGHSGLTLNLGVRMDQENNPAFDPVRFPNVEFGWGDKIAPRLGGAYDLLHNGKVKLYASYGKFFDIMKLGLTRGSFGSDYWHNCVYALDTIAFQTIVPTLTTQGGCPATGQAPGVTGRFIENVDFRATKADTRDPAIQSGMKPVQNHEFVAGADWAITPTLTLETRYSQKRLDNTIEDMSITDNLGFYIGNPGTTFADVLHRNTVIPNAAGVNYLNTTPFCAECPAPPKAVRDYDGLEFRLTKRAGTRWFGSVSYTYSKLRGNYAGLTNTDPTDGGGGRHSPNNGRAFDLPTMGINPDGKYDNGPLATDRPNTAKIFGYYRLPWLGQETWIGVSQLFYQGTPISACLPVVGTSSACQWAEGRGNMPILHRDAATGNIVKDGVVMNARGDNLFQTDLSLRHEIKVNKSHESWRVVLEGNAYNLLNQRAGVGYYEFVIPTGLISPSRASRFSGDPQVDWNKVMTAYNYVDALNAQGSFAGVQAPRTLASRLGMPQIFQTARQFRFAFRFVF